MEWFRNYLLIAQNEQQIDRDYRYFSSFGAHSAFCMVHQLAFQKITKAIAEVDFEQMTERGKSD